MFNFSQLKQLHLEISNNCQAGCPWCLRNYNSGIANPLLKIKNWSLEEFQRIINPEVMSQLRVLNFLGNSGDAQMNNDLPEMCKYAKKINPSINIKIHTNGGMRNTSWWEDLVECLPEKHSLIFGIDGLEDTNHIHRVGVRFEKVIENAKAFINAGGKAQWSFLVFKHNEHQLETARALSKELRFCNFEVKHSSRFFDSKDKPVMDASGNILYSISPPTVTPVKFYTKQMVDTIDKIVTESTGIQCFADNHKEIYIDAHKNVYPCCWLGYLPIVYDPGYTSDIHSRMLDQLNVVIDKIGNINALTSSLEEILNSDAWKNSFDDAWKESGLIKCVDACGKNTPMPDQMQEFVESYTQLR